MIYFTQYPSPIGLLTISTNGTELTGLWIQNQKYYPNTSAWHQVHISSYPILNTAAHWLDSYFLGEHPSINDIPLAPVGTPFRRQVWRCLCEIPYGETTTYGALAKIIAAENSIGSMSSQAIGGAVAHNPISIIIPCHRVVGADGTLTGYAAGTDVKLRLLTLEGVDISRFS